MVYCCQFSRVIIVTAVCDRVVDNRKNALMSQEILMREIIARSTTNDWHLAKTEWTLTGFELLDPGVDSGTCLCGHNPIRELCYIRNQNTTSEVVVGNSCVKRFLGLPTQAVFTSIRRVMLDDSRCLNAQALDILLEKGIIATEDHRLLVESSRKRKISASLYALRRRVNEAGITYFRRRERGVAPLQQP